MQCSEIQFAQAKAEGIVYKLTDGMPPSSAQDAVKRRLCKVFSPGATKVHAANEIHFQPQTANETM